MLNHLNRGITYICKNAALQRRVGKAWLAHCASPKIDFEKNFCGQNRFSRGLNQSNRVAKFSCAEGSGCCRVERVHPPPDRAAEQNDQNESHK